MFAGLLADVTCFFSSIDMMLDDGLKQKALQELKQIFPQHDERLLMNAVLSTRDFHLSPPHLLSNDFSSFLQLCINEFLVTDGGYGGERHTGGLPAISTPAQAKRGAAGAESRQNPSGITSQHNSNPSTSFPAGSDGASLRVNQKGTSSMDSLGDADCAIFIPPDSTTCHSSGVSVQMKLKGSSNRPAAATAATAKDGSGTGTSLPVEPQTGAPASLQTGANSASSSLELPPGKTLSRSTLSEGDCERTNSSDWWDQGQATASGLTGLGQNVANGGRGLGDESGAEASQISDDLTSVMDFLPESDLSEVKSVLSEMRAMYPFSYLDATVDFFCRKAERANMSTQNTVTPLDSAVGGDRSASKERGGMATGTEQKNKDKKRSQYTSCTDQTNRSVDCCADEVPSKVPGVNTAADKEDDLGRFVSALSPSCMSPRHLGSSSHAVNNMASKDDGAATGPRLPALAFSGPGSGLMISSSAEKSAESGRRRRASCVSPPGDSYLPSVPGNAAKDGAQQTRVDGSSVSSSDPAPGVGDLSSTKRTVKSGKKRSDSSKLTYQDYLKAKSSVDRGEFQTSRAEEQKLLAEAAARHRQKRYSRKRHLGAEPEEQKDAVEVSPSKLRKREGDAEVNAHVNNAAAASGAPDVDGEEEDGEKEAMQLSQESGGTSVPALTGEEELMEISDDLDLTLGCDDCGSLRSPAGLAQCNDGHLLCQPCVDKIAKIMLTSSKELLELECPVDNCNFFVPFGEAKRVLYPLVAELLENKLHDATRENIKAMDNIVVCPGCGDIVELDAEVQQFCCRNLDCMVSCCRYCKKDWNGMDHSDCSALLSSLDNISENIGTLPSHWDPIPPDFSQSYMKVELDWNSKEWKEVSQLFLKTAREWATIRAIYRIQNPRLWQKFALMRQHMIADFGQQKVNEQLLFHGTQSRNVDAICKEGFDWRMCGTNGTAYGQGSYFALNSRLSLKYCGLGGGALSFTRGLTWAPDRSTLALYGPLAYTAAASLARGILGGSMYGTGPGGAPLNAMEQARIDQVRSTLAELSAHAHLMPVREQRKKIVKLAASLKLLEAGHSSAVPGHATSSGSGSSDNNPAQGRGAPTGPGQNGGSSFALGQSGGSSFAPGQSGGSSFAPGQSGGSSLAPGQSRGSSLGPGQSGGSSLGPDQSRGSSLGPGQSGGSSLAPGQSGGSSFAPGQSGGSSFAPGQSRGSSLGPGQSGGSSLGLGQSGGSSLAPGQSGGSSLGLGQSGGSSLAPGQSGGSSFGTGQSAFRLVQPGGSARPGSASTAAGHMRIAGQHMQSYYPQTIAASQAFPCTVTPSDEDDGDKSMFVARVLCGRTTRGSPSMRKPPADRSDPSGRLFNSTCDNERKPALYVVYDSAQAYPEYVVRFSSSL